MPKVWIPSLMRDLSGGRESVNVAGVTVRHVIDSLEQTCPGLKQRLCTQDGLRPGIAVSVDGVTSPIGWLQPVRSSSEIHFVVAISGG